MSRWIVASVVLAMAAVHTERAEAQARQVTISAPQLGYLASVGPVWGHSFSLGATVRWNFHEVVGIWGNAQYTIGAGEPAHSPRHNASLAAGVSFSVDLLRVIPWVGIGMRIGVVATPLWTGALPSVEARVGFDVPFNRFVGMTWQLAYGIPVANRTMVEHLFEASMGLRFAIDL